MPRDPRPAATTIDHARRSLQGAERRSAARLGVLLPRDIATWTSLGDRTIVLGRAPDTDVLAVVNATVSRRHVEITWRRGHHVATDLGSRNGTWLNGEGMRPDEPRVLSDGDVLTFGDVVCVYERGVAPAATLAVSEDAVPGNARATRQLRARVEQAAADPSPVLLLGETGTGKEFLAREIHRVSRRRGPLVACNVTELTPQLVESQLFGHERGAFTGADRAQPGLFRTADGGTLFLDEVGELPLALQPKLLRVLQEGEVRPVGATRSVSVDVRIVAATNRDLAADIAAERFRRDLYARLALWEIAVPPLRDRRADIPAWFDRFYAKWRSRRKLPPRAPLELSVRAAESLLLCPWPDNLRGLDRVVHRVAAETADGDAVSASQLAALLPRPTAPGGSEADGEASSAPQGVVSSAKRPAPETAEELAAVMARYDGSVRAVAGHYGRERRQIYRWLDRFGLRD